MKHERIEMNPAVMTGKPVIKGTRVTVELILRKLAAGLGEDTVIDEYGVTREDIRAALSFTADYLHNDELIFG